MPVSSLAADPKWSGEPGRTEVWYATLTEPQSGTGLWVHCEMVSPTLARGAGPYGHGWLALFPPDGSPICERFGPTPIAPGEPSCWFDADGVGAGPGYLRGSAGTISWDLRWEDATPPLWTFPRVAWSRELLPAAQVVLAPAAVFEGEVASADGSVSFDGARGGLAHIYGHGNAARWGWVHADLGGGDVLEIVSAVSTRPGLDKLPPLAFIRLRVDGRDWPAGVLPAVRTRTMLSLPRWAVEGRIGMRRIRVSVVMPAERCVALEYFDPDGEAAVCTNTERADIEVGIDRWTLDRRGGRWMSEREWSIRGTGHAEVGLRAPEAPPPNERRPS